MVYKIILDKKGRGHLPTEVHMEIGDNFVIAKSIRSRCLKIYTFDKWELLSNELEVLSNEDRQKVLRCVAPTDIELDKQRRFFIPSHLCEYAKLETQVVVIRTGVVFEIWNEEDYEKSSAPSLLL